MNLGLRKRVRERRSLRGTLAVVVVLMTTTMTTAFAQQAAPPREDSVRIEGVVFDAAHQPVNGASVRLERKGISPAVETKTNAAGVFEFSDLPSGRYSLVAERSGLRSAATAVLVSAAEQKDIDLVLFSRDDVPLHAASSSAQAMEFADTPTFTVAGVTDWTAVGGHGSDSSLRTSEDLARETLTLKPEAPSGSMPNSSEGAHDTSASESKLREEVASHPQSFEANHELGALYLRAGKSRDALPLLRSAYEIDPTNEPNAYDLAQAYKEAGDFAKAHELVVKLMTHSETADLHRLAGQVDERLGDPLAAVREDEAAVRLDPSEQNYFEWGSELLLHRAIWQAADVFRHGAKAYPKSARMQTALGTALFAGARYDEAALRLCEASDLNPADPEPYVFMGKVEMAAPSALPCVEPKLARFAREQPGNALASYLYAMTIWKRQGQPADPRDMQQMEALLTKAVTLDPKCGDAYLQLGVLYSSQRNYQRAIGSYSKALDADPQLGEAHYRLGVAYDRLGEPEKAKEQFRLHDEIEARQAASVEQQRRDVKQFLIVLQGKPPETTVH